MWLDPVLYLRSWMVFSSVNYSASSSVTHTKRGVELGVRNKQSCHSRETILTIACRDWGKPLRTYIRLADVPVDIWTDSPPPILPPSPQLYEDPVFWFLLFFILYSFCYKQFNFFPISLIISELLCHSLKPYLFVDQVLIPRSLLYPDIVSGPRTTLTL